MTKYRKKPVVIEAVQYPLLEYADNPFAFNPPDWFVLAVGQGVIRPEFRSEDYWYLVIRTLEGEMTVSPDDWIIKGIKSELYPCKPDIFEKTYEPIEENNDILGPLAKELKIQQTRYSPRMLDEIILHRAGDKEVLHLVYYDNGEVILKRQEIGKRYDIFSTEGVLYDETKETPNIPGSLETGWK